MIFLSVYFCRVIPGLSSKQSDKASCSKMKDFFSLSLVFQPGRGARKYFFGGYASPRITNLDPVLKRIYPKIDTPF